MVEATTEHRNLDVAARFLRPEERAATVHDPNTPVVIEPLGSRDVTTLADYLRNNSPQVLQAISNYGAILFRGFDVSTVNEYESLVTGIAGMRGMNQILLSEEGRTVVDGTNFVLYTNARYKTGGTLRFGGFHNENYYNADVPRFISFFCLKPSWMGGETGLLNTAQVYNGLPDSLKRALADRAFWASTVLYADAEEQYGCSPEIFERFCADAGLFTETYSGRKAIALYKPAVMVHPTTGERCLAINYSGELMRHGLEGALVRAFSQDYSGLQWLLHRLLWRHPLLNLKILSRRTRRLIRSRFRPEGGTQSEPRFTDSRVGDLFSKEDMQALARLMRRSYSSFLWRRGDILIVDNLKMAHAGMPGLGPRDLKVILCNSLSVPCWPGPGVFKPQDSPGKETLGAKMTRLCESSHP